MKENYTVLEESKPSIKAEQDMAAAPKRYPTMVLHRSLVDEMDCVRSEKLTVITWDHY